MTTKFSFPPSPDETPALNDLAPRRIPGWLAVLVIGMLTLLSLAGFIAALRSKLN